VNTKPSLAIFAVYPSNRILGCLRFSIFLFIISNSLPELKIHAESFNIPQE
jgi:hypothetical protein